MVFSEILTNFLLKRTWKGDKTELRRIQLIKRSGNSNETHLLGGRCEIKMFDLSTTKAVHKLAGHSEPILDMKVTSDGMYAVTCASGDRYINIWSLDLDNPNDQAVRILVSDSFIRHLDIRYTPQQTDGSDGKRRKKSSNSSPQMFVSGTTSEGREVSLWSVQFSDETKKKSKKNEPLSPSGSLSFHSPPLSSDPPLLACVFSSSNPAGVLIISGLRLKPNISLEEIISSDGNISSHHQLTSVTSSVSVSDGVQDKEMEEGKAKIVKGNERHFKKGEDQSIEKKILDDTHMEHSSSSHPSSVQVFDTRSFLEKLDALERKVAKVPKNSEGGSAPKAESLQSAVEQALHSDDPSLLESCLQVSGLPVIHATCQRLSTPYVLPFLKSLIRRLEGNPNRAGRLVPWIRSLLHYQSAYLMSLSDIGIS